MDPSDPYLAQIPTESSLEARLGNTQLEQYPLKRKYQELSSSSSGLSSLSYDGPVVAVEDDRAGFGFSHRLPQLPLRKKLTAQDEPRRPLWADCRQETIAILQEARLAFDDVRVLKVKEADRPHYTPTLQIRVPDTRQKDLWRPTLVTVGQMFNQRAALDLRVVLSVPGSETTKKTFVIPADHGIVEVWSSALRDPILQLLDDIDFLELGMWYWGETRQSAKLTIVIVVEDKISDEWDQLTQDILKICAPSKVAVDVIEGHFEGNFELDLGARAGKHSYVEKVPMGHSMGIERTGGGTMGGYLMLVDPKDANDRRPVFLTNWHVVRPSDPNLPAEWDYSPQTYGSWPKGISNVVQSPALADVSSEINAHQNFLRGSARFRFLSRKIESNLPLNAQEQDTYDSELAAMDERRARLVHLQTLKTTDHHFGTVKMISGYKMTGQPSDIGSKPANPKAGGPRVGVRPLDWAIGEPKMHRIGGNVLPSQDELAQKLSGSDTFILGTKTHVKFINHQLLTPGSIAFKVGRTTGLTTGVVHAIPVTTGPYQWPAKKARWFMPPEFQLDAPVKVAIDLPPNASRKSSKRTHVEISVIKGFGNDPFNRGGDSGSWILDATGALVGLLWGGCSGSDDCYFMPIKDVIDDIEKRTGKKVEMYN